MMNRRQRRRNRHRYKQEQAIPQKSIKIRFTVDFKEVESAIARFNETTFSALAGITELVGAEFTRIRNCPAPLPRLPRRDIAIDIGSEPSYSCEARWMLTEEGRELVEYKVGENIYFPERYAQMIEEAQRIELQKIYLGDPSCKFNA
ncbi:MAG: hypothetical protein HWQ38_18940 [Nostoc sp. NMS7]|uniref:hypothetical protein n=1 Tax=Nostoc sp. NMS7 TaxID=2815391 RepID=UPI0025EC6261|nr:hypothetical protein [Nostoc sp. NMS7]MBN3948413.1 hypothetical protein [Nostoc sp. NMS7]